MGLFQDSQVFIMEAEVPENKSAHGDINVAGCWMDRKRKLGSWATALFSIFQSFKNPWTVKMKCLFCFFFFVCFSGRDLSKATESHWKDPVWSYYHYALFLWNSCSDGVGRVSTFSERRRRLPWPSSRCRSVNTAWMPRLVLERK